MGRAIARLATPAPSAPPRFPEGPQWVTVPFAASHMGVSVIWLYRHWRRLGLGRKLSHRQVRIDLRAVERWMRSRRAQ